MLKHLSLILMTCFVLGELTEMSAENIGPHSNPELEELLSSYSKTKKLRAEYNEAVEKFKEAYGSSADPYDVVLLRATRFMEKNNWDRLKEAGQFNPIAMTDYYNYQRNPNQCRLQDLSGRPINVWSAFERASTYVEEVTQALSNRGQKINWSPSYKTLPHIRKWQRLHGRSRSESSSSFDLDVILSIHAEAGLGATQNDSSCGKLGQVKVCDGHSYSPFFHPSYRPHPCSTSGWSPSENDWKILLSEDMRELGSSVVPVPNKSSASSLRPAEFFGDSCGSSRGKEKVKDLLYSSSARLNDWPGVKNVLPQKTRDYLGRHEGSVSTALRRDLRNVGAYSIYSSVEQSYKDLVNYRIRPSLMSTMSICSECESKTRSGYVWDMASRGTCPKQCFIGGYAERDSSVAKSTDVLRQFFEPDRSDREHRSVAKLVNDHFFHIAYGYKFRADPVKVAAEVQRKLVALHPFIDGNGRVSRFLMEMILHSSGLPFPILSDFWSDTTSKLDRYQKMVEEGIERHTETLAACADFVLCLDDEGVRNPSQKLCELSTNTSVVRSCANKHLEIDLENGRTDSISPCSCSTNWNKNPSQVRYNGCR